MKKMISLCVLMAMLVSMLCACGSSEPAPAATEAPATEAPAAVVETIPAETEPVKKIVITVGCLAREEPDILYVANALKDSPYEIVPQIFSDVITTNMATQEGEIDANFTQNKNYLKNFNESNGTTLVAPGEPISTFPEGLYSRKYKSLEELPEGATIAISNDPTNRARELGLLEACGLIELAEGVDLPTLLDVTANAKNINILEMESRSKWGAYDDVDAIVVTAVTIMQQDDPEKPSTILAVESMEVTMTIAGTCLVVAEENADAEWLAMMNEVMHTDGYAAHLAETYKGAKVPMFESDAFNVNYFE